MQNGSEIIRTEKVGVRLSSTPGVQELEGYVKSPGAFPAAEQCGVHWIGG